MTTATQTAIRGFFVAFVKGANKVSDAMAKVAEQRVGTYTNMVLAGIEAETVEAFDNAAESFADDIRNNRDKLATSLKCAKAKRQPKGQPKNRPVYTVPSAFMAARSYIKAALEHGVGLGDSDSPCAFTQVRADVMAIKAAERVETLTGDDKVRYDIGATIEAIESRADSAKGDNLAKIQTICLAALAQVREVYGIDEQREQRKAELAAEANAEASAEVTAEDKPSMSRQAAALIEEHGIDWRDLEPSGKNGGITVADVRRGIDTNAELAAAA